MNISSGKNISVSKTSLLKEASNSRFNNVWYREGLGFECTLSGNCCTGPPGFVWVDKNEIEATADHLGISKAQFISTYTHKLNGRCSITEVKTEFGYDCIFLDRKAVPGKAVCGIYDVRPQQCRTWPFWPENINSQKQWERAGRYCPGINKGKLIPADEIRIQCETTPE